MFEGAILILAHDVLREAQAHHVVLSMISHQSMSILFPSHCATKYLIK